MARFKPAVKIYSKKTRNPQFHPSSCMLLNPTNWTKKGRHHFLMRMMIWWQYQLQSYSSDGQIQACGQNLFRKTPCPPISSQLMYAFNPNQLNQGDDVIINQWEWWSDDIPHDTLCLGTKFVTFRHQNWAICMFRSKWWAWLLLHGFNSGLQKLSPTFEPFNLICISIWE